MPITWSEWSIITPSESQPLKTQPGTAVNLVGSWLSTSDPSGAAYVCTGQGYNSWTAWQSVADGGSIAGAGVTGATYNNSAWIAVVLADPLGGIFVSAAHASVPGFVWGPWKNIPAKTTAAGSTVNAYSNYVTQGIDLYMTDATGVVSTASGVPYGEWSGWSSPSDGSARAGSPVTMITYENQPNIFIADPGGYIYTIFKDSYGYWVGWAWVSRGQAVPGAPVTAILVQERQSEPPYWTPGVISLFIADSLGDIFTVSGTPGNWGPWESVAGGRTIPGAKITPLVYEDATGKVGLVLFSTDENGSVQTTTKNSQTGVWNMWKPISNTSIFAPPGAPVSAILWAVGQVAIFISDIEGNVKTSTSITVTAD